MVLNKLRELTRKEDRETRVNLKHLLEDIRDSYPCTLEETILVELVANALDAQPSEIRFLVNRKNDTLTVTDNGSGMNQGQLENYHDIAATTKVRGKGIGFAGVGAKLSLLIAAVTTETKYRTFHASTKWWLENERRAPWKPVSAKANVKGESGTAVSIALQNAESPLLNPEFVRGVMQRHFYPLLDSEFNIILGNLYNRGIKFYVNDAPISLEPAQAGEYRSFLVHQGRRKRPSGIGIIQKSGKELPEDSRGIAISTYGKVIKRGWDWVGITPRNPALITGVVEMPALSEILTTNKADFLRDAASLNKYYSYRKAIQAALLPVLKKLGEIIPPTERPEKKVRPLEKEVEHVLDDMLRDFPELSPLLGRKSPGEPAYGVLPDEKAPPIGRVEEGVESMSGTEGGEGEGGGVDIAPGSNPGERIEPDPEAAEKGKLHEGRKRHPSLMVGYEDDPSLQEVGRFRENTVWINKSHPAYKKVGQGISEKYYAHVAIALVLSGHLEEGKSPLDFINQYLKLWGEGN